MKYIKLILVIATTASVAGFVVWHLMWMTGIEKRFKEELSSGVINMVDIRESKSEGQKGNREKNRPLGEEETMSLKDSGPQINQTGKTQQETEKQVSSKADGGTSLPLKETKPESLKEDGKWFEKDIGLGKKQQEVKPGPGKIVTVMPNDQTMSGTINNINQVMQKKIPQPQPIQRPEVKVSGVVPYPTSTAP